MEAESRGLDQTGKWTVEIQVTGEAPIVEPSASVRIKSLSHDLIQVCLYSACLELMACFGGRKVQKEQNFLFLASAARTKQQNYFIN